MTAYILQHDPVANNKDNSKKNGKCSMSDASVASIVGGRNQKDLDLRFHDIKECEILSVDDKTTLKG